jgi:beta-xylosidase
LLLSALTFRDNWMNNKVLAKVAYRPTGPWSDPITLYQATPVTNGSSIYAAVPHPYYDESGKNLVVTFTNHPNVIQAVNVVSPPMQTHCPLG